MRRKIIRSALIAFGLLIAVLAAYVIYVFADYHPARSAWRVRRRCLRRSPLLWSQHTTNRTRGKLPEIKPPPSKIKDAAGKAASAGTINF